MRNRTALSAAWLLLAVQAPQLCAATPNFPVPQVTPLEQNSGFNDEPSMSRAADGSVYVAWNSFRDRADSLQIARYQVAGEGFKSVGAWQVLGGKGTYILAPKTVAAGEGVFVLYAVERGRNWEVFAVPCNSAGPGRPVNLSNHPGVDFKPAGTWQDGTLWVAWESNRGGTRQVLLASLKDGHVSRVEAVSPTGSSCYAPSIAVASNGLVSVAFHSFREHNYDIFLRQRRSDGEWLPERRLTRAATVDRHPTLFTHGDDLWLLYENAQTDAYHTGHTINRQIIVAKISGSGLQTPKKGQDGSPLITPSEAAAAAFDDTGRLWIAFMRQRLPRGGWEVHFTGYNGEKWEREKSLSLRRGMDRQPSLAIDGRQAIIAFQADESPESWAMRDQSMTDNARSRILLATVGLGQATPAASAMVLEPLVESEAPFAPGKLRVAYGEDAVTPVIDYQGKKLKLFYGDLHTHTDVSVCNRCQDQSVDESYQCRRDINRLDFACTTDHDYNFVPYLWCYTAKMARVNEDPGRMVTFLGEEWTSNFLKISKEHPYGYYGHRNLIFADPFFSRWWNAFGGQTPSGLWKELRAADVNFVNIPHQLADTGNVPVDWNYVDEKAQPVAEIFQHRGSYEYKSAPREAIRAMPESGSFIQDVWERGTVIGVIASPDHGGGLGKACVYAPDLSREAILNGLRARHTFGTTAARIFLDVRVNGHLMGEKIPAPRGKPVEVKIDVRTPGDIDRIEICRNNKFVYVATPGGRHADLAFLDNEPLPGRSFYYVRVMQKDKEIAWSSPVWLGFL